MNCTLVLPLTRIWNSSDAPFSVIPKPPQPIYNFQSLWFDEVSENIFTFGGEQSRLDSKSPVDLSTWKLTLDGNGDGEWKQNATFQDPPFSEGLTRPFGGASVTDGTTAFYMDGYSSSKSSPMTQGLQDFVPTPGIVTYDFQNGMWSNTTATRKSKARETFLWGGAEFVPLGPNGLIVMFGGESSQPQSYIPGDEQRSMSNITLFDPVTKLWYEETANSAGNRMPSPRLQFCTVGVGDLITMNNDTRSHEMSVSRRTVGITLRRHDQKFRSS